MSNEREPYIAGDDDGIAEAEIVEKQQNVIMEGNSPVFPGISYEHFTEDGLYCYLCNHRTTGNGRGIFRFAYDDGGGLWVCNQCLRGISEIYVEHQIALGERQNNGG